MVCVCVWAGITRPSDKKCALAFESSASFIHFMAPEGKSGALKKGKRREIGKRGWMRRVIAQCKVQCHVNDVTHVMYLMTALLFLHLLYRRA